MKSRDRWTWDEMLWAVNYILELGLSVFHSIVVVGPKWDTSSLRWVRKVSCANVSSVSKLSFTSWAFSLFKSWHELLVPVDGHVFLLYPEMPIPPIPLLKLHVWMWLDEAMTFKMLHYQSPCVCSSAWLRYLGLEGRDARVTQLSLSTSGESDHASTCCSSFLALGSITADRNLSKRFLLCNRFLILLKMSMRTYCDGSESLFDEGSSMHRLNWPYFHSLLFFLFFHNFLKFEFN